MATPNREAIDTFMSITGASEAVAVQMLEEHLCDLNEAVNAYFNEGDRNNINDTSAAARTDFMEVDNPSLDEPLRDPFRLLSAAQDLNPFSLLDPNFRGTMLGQNSEFTGHAPIVSHPREVREIPIEVKDGASPPGRSPTIEEVTGTTDVHGPEVHGTVIVDDNSDEDNPTSVRAHGTGSGDGSREDPPRPSAPEFDDFPDYSNDIEAEMVQAAIEASKREAESGYHNQKIDPNNDLGASVSHQNLPPLEDAELAQAVSLSLKTAKQEESLREQGVKGETSERGAHQPAEVNSVNSAALNGRLEGGRSYIEEEAEDAEEQPLIMSRSRHRSSRLTESSKQAEKDGVAVSSPSSSPAQHDIDCRSQANVDSLQNDVWGGMSSVEHDEAVMLEAAMFGGIPEGGNYGMRYAPHQYMRDYGSTRGSYPQQPRPPSPSLEAQRMIREQQDDEYLASLQADREKELKASEEAEARRVMEIAAREAALEEERLKEERSRKKLEEEEEFERQLAAKEASLPPEPSLDDEDAVTVLVRMPDGSRRGRRFLKSDKLKSLYDFIDVGRGVKPGTYRLVQPYPRHAFGDGESGSTLNELGLNSKQEALFLELI